MVYRLPDGVSVLSPIGLDNSSFFAQFSCNRAISADACNQVVDGGRLYVLEFMANAVVQMAGRWCDRLYTPLFV